MVDWLKVVVRITQVFLSHPFPGFITEDESPRGEREDSGKGRKKKWENKGKGRGERGEGGRIRKSRSIIKT